MPRGTKYGFQLFTVHLHMRTSRPTIDFVKGRLEQGGSSLAKSFRDALPSLVNKTRVGPLSYREQDDDSKSEKTSDTKPAIRVVLAEVASDNRIDFEFRYGRVGSHDLAIAEDASQDAVLSGKASTNEFRASLYLPTSGHKALLVVENRSNLCPTDYFLKHLSFHFKELDDALQDQDRGGWWRMMAQGVTDSERLDEVLLQGRGAALQLEKFAPSVDGRRRSAVTTLRQDGLPLGKLAQIRALAYDWLDLRNPDTDPAPIPSGSNSVEQVATLIDVKIIAEQFDDGAIVYDDGNGRTQTIRPQSVRDVFVYPVSEGSRPTASQIRTKAEARIRKLMPTIGIQIAI